MTILAVLLTLAPIGSARAQAPSATISGIVTDPTGAVLPGVTVTATNVATARQALVTTNDRGFYVLTPLPVGTYVVDATLAGFRTYRREAVLLTTAATIALDIQLSLGDLSDTVTVAREATLVETRTSDVGQLIESRTVQEMPLGDRRAMNLIRTIGAAAFVSYDAGAKPNFTLAGGRTQSQMFWIDGGTGQNMRLGIGQIDIDPPVETLQEVKVISNNYSAEYGGSAGGVIIATTKSGTNTFRAIGFEYLRNDAFDAANAFAPVADGKRLKPPLRYNVFGATVGGPLRRDRTFFFTSYEGSRRRTGLTRIFTVPTALQRAGDFSQTVDARGNLIVVYDPATTRVEGGRVVRVPFPDNRIPIERRDPVALKLLAFYPLPNRQPDTITGANNFSANHVQVLTRDNYTLKIDHHLTARDTINFRYLYNSDNRGFTTVFPDPAADTLTDALRHQNYFYAGYTRVIGQSLVNELRYTYSNRINHERSFGLGQPWPSRFGLTGVSDEAFPRVAVSGVTALGATTHERRQFPIEQHQIVDTISWLQGRHAFKAGGEVRPSLNFEVNRPSVSGAFTFGTQATGVTGGASGHALASLLLGLPERFDLRETDVLDRSSWYLAAFVQDDWTIGPRLTLNLGLRWETDTPIRDSHDRMNGFDPDAINPVSGTRGVVRFAGQEGWPSAPYRTDWNNFGPRLGFAWRPAGTAHTVVRGGAGIFFAHPFDHGAPSSAALGFEQSASIRSADGGFTAPFRLRDGVPPVSQTGAVRDARFGAVAPGRPATTSVSFYERDRATGYAQQFNLGIQQELGGGFAIEAAYVANLSHKLPSPNVSINQVPPEKMGTSATPQADRPFPQFSDVLLLFPTFGRSNYHAAVLRVEKRFSRGFNLLATYTASRFRNDTDEGGAALGETGVYSDFYNRRADYGPSANDIPHRLTVSTVYELPFGPGRRFLSSMRRLRPLVGDWSIGMLASMQSGAPFSVTTLTNTTNAFSAGALRADVRGEPELPSGERTTARWFNTDAFRQPAPFTFGDGRRGLLRGPGEATVDLLAAKHVPLGGERLLQVRVEVFNALNRVNLGLPAHVLGAPAFGVISSAGPARTLQLGVRILF